MTLMSSTNAPLTIVADANIAELETYFAPLGQLIKRPGREISQRDVQNADILLVRSITSVNQALLADSAVRFVGSATIGLDHLDTNYLDTRGIAWANAPGSNADAVVDYVLSALCRIDGLWTRLFNGATVGIVGLGNVGGRLYQRLAALGITCLAYDPLLAPERYPILSDFNTVMAADVLCLHTPLTRTGPYPTYHLFDRQRLAILQPNSVLLNAGRGSVIDHHALYQCLQQRSDIRVVLDVWEHEPKPYLPLMDRVTLATPHIAGYSVEGKSKATRHIQQACCAALGLHSPDLSRPPHPPEPATTAPTITLQPASPSHSVQQAILSCYDILHDDQAMRTAFKQQPNSAFDQLRQHYPARHAFSYYTVDVPAGSDPKVGHYLRAAGFTTQS